MVVGEMVRADGGGPLMKIISRWNDQAHCVWVDQRGVIHRRDFDVNRLSPFWLTIGPRTTWPEITQIDLIAIDREERKAASAREASKKAAKRARRSNKLKRRSDAAA